MSIALSAIFLVMSTSQITLASLNPAISQHKSDGVEINGRPVNLIADNATNDLYVSSQTYPYSISIIDLKDDTISKTVNKQDSVSEMNIDPITGTIFMLNTAGNRIYLMDPATDKIINNLTVSKGSSSFSEVPGGSVYVANPTSKTLVQMFTSNAVINTYNLTESPTDVRVNQRNVSMVYLVTQTHLWRLYQNNSLVKIPIGFLPNPMIGEQLSKISINPNTNLLYVLDSNTNSNGSVLIINGTTNKVIDRISVGKNSQSIAVNPYMNKIYIANLGDGTVSVIYGNTNQKQTIKLGGTPKSIAITYTSSSPLVYVADPSNRIVHIICVM